MTKNDFSDERLSTLVTERAVRGPAGVRQDPCRHRPRQVAVKTAADSSRRELFTEYRGGRPVDDWCVAHASGKVEKRAELPAHARLLHGDIAGELVLVELSPDETPTLATKRLHPHGMPHSTAVHLLGAGVDITTISHWLSPPV